MIALIVIDMQRDFLDPAGYIARSGVDVSPLRAIIPEVGSLLQAARRSKNSVIQAFRFADDAVVSAK